MKRRIGGLGSGLDALLPGDSQGGAREVPVSSIRQNPRQPRTHFDEAALDDLAASIREHGIIQPLIVSQRGEGTYELVAGERRWRAAQRAGLAQVPILVRETTPQQLLELALIENVQRADLNPIEEAVAYQSLKDEFGLSDDQIAQRVGKNNRVTIANTRRLLKLPAAAQDALLASTISAGHGRALLKLEAAEQQAAALEAIITDELSVREAERLGDLAVSGIDLSQALTMVRRERAARGGRAAPTARSAAAPAARPSPLSPDDQQIARSLEQILGTPVGFVRGEKQLQVTITFYDDEMLQAFFDRLNG